MMRTTSRFVLREAVTDEEKKLHYRMRYEVYVEEIHSVRLEELSPDDRRNKLERDWYDELATPFVFVDTQTGEYVGAVRFIPDTPRGFLMEARFPLPSDINRGRTVELSRFLVRRQFRGREAGFDRHDIAIGMYRWSREHGITAWCAAMQVWLLYAFLKDGIAFELIGPITKRYHNTAVVPVLLRDLDAGIRYMWRLNRSLHFRYTDGQVLPPLPSDHADEVVRRVEHDREIIRKKLKWLYPVGTIRALFSRRKRQRKT